jgi:hypothetical protein
VRESDRCDGLSLCVMDVAVVDRDTETLSDTSSAVPDEDEVLADADIRTVVDRRDAEGVDLLAVSSDDWLVDTEAALCCSVPLTVIDCGTVRLCERLDMVAVVVARDVDSADADALPDTERDECVADSLDTLRVDAEYTVDDVDTDVDKETLLSVVDKDNVLLRDACAATGR